jgi:hypothetical protein
MCVSDQAMLIVHLNGWLFCMLSCDSVDFVGWKLHQKRWLNNVHTNKFGGKLLGNNHILSITITNNSKLLIDLDPTRLYTWRAMTQNLALNVYHVYYALGLCEFQHHDFGPLWGGSRLVVEGLSLFKFVVFFICDSTHCMSYTTMMFTYVFFYFLTTFVIHVSIQRKFAEWKNMKTFVYLVWNTFNMSTYAWGIWIQTKNTREHIDNRKQWTLDFIF